MNYRRPVVLEMLSQVHAILLFAAVYPFLAGLLDFSGSIFLRISATGILLFLPVTASFLLNRKVKFLALFSLSGVAITTVSSYLAYLWGGTENYAGLICGAVTGISSAVIFGLRIYTKVLYGKTKRDFYAVHSPDTPFELKGRELPSPLNSPKLYHLIWFTGLYIVEMLLHHKNVLYFLFGIVFADIFVCLSYQYISALYEYIRSNQRLEHLPLASMRRIHRLVGVGFALVLALFLLPSLLYGREFDLRPASKEPVLTPQTVTQPENHGNYIPDQTDTETPPSAEPLKPPPQWILTLLRLFGCLVAVSIVITALILLFHIIRSLGKEFAETEEEDEVVFIKQKKTDAGEAAFSGRQQEGFFSKRQQIRRQYRRIIKKETKGAPSSTATPAELEQNASLSGTPEMDRLHKSYEKARYDKL